MFDIAIIALVVLFAAFVVGINVYEHFTQKSFQTKMTAANVTDMRKVGSLYN